MKDGTMEVSYLEHNGYVIYEETEEDKLWTAYCDFMDCNGYLMSLKEYAESIYQQTPSCQVTVKESK